MADIPEYMTYSYLRNLRQNNAAWRLLTADQAAFIAAFFYREFIAGKRRGIEAQELLERLDLFLYDAQRQSEGEESFPCCRFCFGVLSYFPERMRFAASL